MRITIGLFALLAVACGTEVAAQPFQMTTTPVVTPTSAPVATTTSKPISTATQVVSAACLQAILTALQGHHHNEFGDTGRIGQPTYTNKITFLNYGTERELAALLEPCDSFR